MCQGSSEGMSTTGTKKYRYDIYKYRYSNCTYVDGNLEINELDENADLSFLSSIEEVKGYVLISTNFMRRVPLTKLRIIRGRTLYEFDSESYSLFVSLNNKPNSTTDGLMELGFTNLKGEHMMYLYIQTERK